MLPSRFSPKGKLIPGKLKRNGLLSLFVLTLSLAIVLGTVMPLQSKPVLPSTQASPSTAQKCAVPDDLCEKIKQRAKKDVEKEVKERDGIKYAIEDFRIEHPRWNEKLSEKERNKIQLAIRDTYEPEFERLSNNRKRDPMVTLAKFFENGLWGPSILALLGIVVAWFKDAIGKKLTALVKKIYDWVYSKFAGTQLFESVALQRYREALAENYQHLKIPFRVNQKPLEMSEVYVPLKVAGSSDSDQVDAFGMIAQHRRLMITGIPGSGKTMLLRHIAFSYGTGRLLGLENRPVPVLVELHRLSDPELTEEKLIAAIVEAFKRNRFPDAGRFVSESLKQGKLMLLLDGLDEVNSAVRPVLVQRISDLLKTFDGQQRCRLIVTCRTAVYDHEFANETDQTLEVVEFTDQQMRRFLDAWQREIPAGNSIDQLMQTLRDRPRIMALARNPLLLTIIAHLYTDPSFELPRSRTEFYEVSTRILLEQWQDQLNKYRGGDKRRVLQYLALQQQQASTQQLQDRRSIDYPVVLEKIRQLLPSLNLAPDRDTIPLLDELVERSGLFLKIDGGDRYQFAHLTLQEYFAAVALADKPNELIQFFRQDPTTWREVVKLWCGIAGDSTTLIKEVYQLDTVLGFECLADAQEVDQQTAESIIEHCKGLLGNSGEQDEIVKAFGAVAASDRPRGQAVFQFLQTVLDQPTEQHRHIAIAQALSFSNRPQAANSLALRYADLYEIVRQPLIRMGDIAVPELAQLAIKGILSASEDLYLIGTPDAAKALVSRLWEQEQVMSIAAWYLTSLLLQPGIEEALNDLTFNALSNIQNLANEKSEKDFDWVWEPFQSSPNSAMKIIMGRIAYGITFSLEHGFNYVPSKSTLALDLRLVVPIFVLHMSSHSPIKWDLEHIRVFLEQQENTEQMNHQTIRTVDTFFTQLQVDKGSLFLLKGLPPKLQLDLLHSLVKASNQPNRDDWINIFESVQYEFKTSQDYRTILLIAALLSILACVGVWHSASVLPIGSMTGLMGLAVFIIILFWQVLAKGVEEHWEPNLFIKLGPLGLQTYGIELLQLFQTGIVWPGIEVIFNLLLKNSTFAFDVVTFAGTLTFAGAVVVAVAVTFAVAGALIFAGAVAGVFAVVFAGAVAVVFAGAGYTMSILAGLGVGIWYRLKAKPETQWLKVFAILALPWFCAAPVVLIFAGVGLTSLFNPLVFLPIPPWLSAGLLELFLIGVSIWLWQRGQKLDAMARNPLHLTFA